MRTKLFIIIAVILMAFGGDVYGQERLNVCDIQEVPVGRDSSFYTGDTVITSGIVVGGTGLYYAGAGVTFYMQDPECNRDGDPFFNGEFSGIMAYNPEASGFPDLYPGDSISVEALVSEYVWVPPPGVDQVVHTELFIVDEGFTFHSYGNPEPPPIDSVAVAHFDSIGGADSLGERYESVLCKVYSLKIDSVVNYTNTCTWICSDSITGNICYVREASDSIDNDFRPPPGTIFTWVTGVVYHRFGLYHLQPRYMRDFSFDNVGPIIGSPETVPEYPMYGDDIDFRALILDPDGEVEEASLFMRTNINENFDQYDMEPYEENRWHYEAPSSMFEAGDRVDYYMFASDNEGNPSYNPTHAPISFYSFFYQLPQDATIAEIKADLDGNYEPDSLGKAVGVAGIVTAYQFADTSTNIYIEDGTGGVNVYYGENRMNVTYGDSVYLQGIIDQYNGKTEVVFFDEERFENRGSGHSFDTLTITCADLADTTGEQYEGKLVQIRNVTLSPDPDEWPILGESATMTITDGTGEAALRIDRNTNIDGNSEPSSPMHIVGVVGQYDYTRPYSGGYQLQPREYADFSPAVGIGEDDDGLPKVFALRNNYPNPFNPATSVGFDLPKDCTVAINVFDIMGRKVKTLVDAPMSAGVYEIAWDGTNESGRKVSSGIYFYKMNAGDFNAVKKMTLLK
ncbi:MAG: T9SS type A sorting domain-containing protein [candidate division Zixibacteria bacterium]|nr:T9SS type A sorting domain-containing protein [candidate division Zixibacteria bacterium]